MTFTPDMNTCIRYFTNRSTGVVQRMSAPDPREIALCDIVRAEFYYGAYKSQRRETNLALRAPQYMPVKHRSRAGGQRDGGRGAGEDRL